MINVPACTADAPGGRREVTGAYEVVLRSDEQEKVAELLGY